MTCAALQSNRNGTQLGKLHLQSMTPGKSTPSGKGGKKTEKTKTEKAKDKEQKASRADSGAHDVSIGG